ncbi:hypothetical protein N7507_004043 [Penicillium longicatenatum]|nr:hypothetical protein N7507_004043 [Penicillium longicatenatum]
MEMLLHKACDTCRARKARCKMSGADACEFCLVSRSAIQFPGILKNDEYDVQSRNSPCSFSYVKQPRKRKLSQPGELPVRSGTIPDRHEVFDSQQVDRSGTLSTLYIDTLLADRQASRIRRGVNHPDQLMALCGPNPNISFFPEKRVRLISQRLGNHRLEHLLEEIRELVASRVRLATSIPGSKAFQGRQSEPAQQVLPHESFKAHILVYFEMVHPLYPFLCAETFQRQASAPNLLNLLATDRAWAALYYAVVAIGCQYNEGGSFEAGVGEAWTYFERSLSHFQDIIFCRGSLTAVQALMAMAIFSSTPSAFQFEPLMLSEAAIMAQGLGYNRSNSLNEESHRRTFWVLYFMEKVSCFMTGKVSVLQDSNISCAIPDVKVSTFYDYDWFFSFLQYGRLVSKIHSDLFTISSTNQPVADYSAKVQVLLQQLEAWRLSSPMRFRAGEQLKPRLLREPLAQTVALMTHYLYLNALLTLSWTLLHSSAARLRTNQQLELKRELMRTARSVLELTKYIDVAPSTPIWILGVMPLSCLLILFDLVVHNPEHPETGISLALLDIAGGHFSRLEFASKGTLPGSLIAEFAHLARQYVTEKRQEKNKYKTPDSSTNEPGPSIQPAVTETTGTTQSVVVFPGAEAENYNQMADSLPALSQEPLAPGPSTTPLWTPNTLHKADELFLPLIDDPSYHIDGLELLGIDLKDLFDHPYPILDGVGL